MHADTSPKVKDLIRPNSKKWNIDMLNSLFSLEIVRNIDKIYVPRNNEEDEYIWLPNENGIHT